MSEPTLQANDQADLAVARAALAGGHLARERVRELLLQREQEGDPARGLLELLDSGELAPEALRELEEVHRQALSGGATEVLDPAGRAGLPTLDETLRAGAETRVDPPSGDDPPAVQEFLARLDATAGAPTAPSLQRLGRYLLLHELARGGMGAVYRARDVTLGREVALKVLLGGDDPDELRRFEREARATAQLRHPGIVPVYEYGNEGGRPYLAMELIDGETLRARVRREGPLPGAEAARLVRALAEAVAAAHAAGILHRDLKPANVLLTAAGEPRLTDFGLAKRVDLSGSGLTVSGQVLGTPAYMAPEQARGEHAAVDARADVYGLGAVLYELLTGVPPFQGPTLLHTLAQVTEEEPTPPGRLRPGLERALETICLQCLEKDPARRYPGAEALAADLKRFLGGQRVRARAPSAFQRARRWVRRRPVRVAVVVALTCAGVAWGLTDAAASRRQRALNELYQRAFVEYGQGKLDEAQAFLDRAGGLDARNAAVWDLRGSTHTQRAQREPAHAEALRAEALRCHERAVALAPDNAMFALNVAIAQFNLGRLEASRAAYDRALALDPRNSLAWFNRGVTRGMLGDLSGSVADYEQSLAINPENSYAYHQLGLARFNLGELPAAEAAYEQALALNDQDAVAWNGRGFVRANSARLPAALEDFSRAIELQPRYSEPYAHRAFVQRNLGRPAEAWRDAERAIELDPRNAVAVRNRGLLRADRGELAEARADYERALAIQPGDAVSYNLRGALNALEGDARAALQDFDRALELTPRYSDAAFNRGNLHAQAARWQEAERDFSAVIAALPQHPWALHNRAYARAAQGRADEALGDYDASLAAAPDNVLALHNRGLTRAGLGDQPGALADFDRALELQPDQPGTLHLRGVLQAELGNAADAVRDLRRALVLFGPTHALRPNVEAALRAAEAAREGR